MKRKIWGLIIIFSIVFLCISVINNRYSLISIPSSESMLQTQIDFITISTVFAGFSFTALSMLLGLSSERLIRLIKDTNIVLRKVSRLIVSITFFILSVAISLIFIIKVDFSFIKESYKIVIDNSLYILGLGYLVAGIVYFVVSVYELWDLIKRVYTFNNKNCNIVIEKAKKEMEYTTKKMREINDNHRKY